MTAGELAIVVGSLLCALGFAAPVIKTVALATGSSRAARRLRRKELGR